MLVFQLSLGSIAYSEAAATPANEHLAERPGAGGASTKVTVTAVLLDIGRINDVDQRVTVDLFLNIAWSDPRLALPPAQRRGHLRTLPLDAVWSPRGLIVNDRGLSMQLPLAVEVDDSGNVMYRQRLAGDLSVDLDFREFPFDVQRLPIEIVSYQYSPDQVHFSTASRMAGNIEAFSAEGWQFELLEPAITEFRIESLHVVRPQLVLAVEATRNSRYYVLTMFIPVTLIMFMAWMAFWIQPSVVPPRIAIATASIFSLIAFGFSLRLSLPLVSYVTRADIFVLGCTMLVFIALGIAVVGSRWAGADRMEQAVQLNAAARWAYLILFLGVIAATALI
jgi:hypothetical protein